MPNKRHRPVLVAVVSDTHCGSMFGLAPPQGVELPEGSRWVPGETGKWQWECWMDALDNVARIRRQEKAALYFVANGDLVDGLHHQSAMHELITTNAARHKYIAKEVFSPVKALRPTRVFVTQGTSVHVGPEGASEEFVGEFLRSERRRHHWTAVKWRFEIPTKGGSVLFDCQHHPGTRGTKPHTRESGVARLAEEIWNNAKKAQDLAIRKGKNPRKFRAPDVAVRSHYHDYAMSSPYSSCPVLACITPPWQVKTGYAQQRASPESYTTIGMVTFLIEPDGSIHPEPFLYQSEPEPIWAEGPGG